ncbi:DEAD/DEAH box helicase [Chondrinema litorale]|uniref:DEAD/DEAH box helicase n=1 Tax=Chondrinema litorale TaxID=2994555 RepID=UPI002542A158|nr:DEAD/DEAH box helicase [Chondrinema litorale]UZS00213.1 DEAD/DEAH box helicase [Chondrinema litorale]
MTFKGLFIGIDRYVSREATWLNCAVRDAQALHALFTDTLGGNTKLLSNEDAIKNSIEKELESLTNCNINDVVVISFSGHGSETHELVPYDYNSQDVKNTAISLESLQQWFEKIPAQTLILILDCCFSGGMGAKVLKVDYHPKILKSTTTLLDQLSGHGRIILTASGADEEAWESQKTGHGLLTHFLIEALQGVEEVQIAGKISIFKLLEYVSRRVVDAADSFGHPQNPTLRGTLDSNITWPVFKPGDLYEKYFPDHSHAIANNDLQSLKVFGFSTEIINGWSSSIPELNELQLAAINQHKILKGKHVVVSAPTSSGKTMIGELASLKCVLDGKKALFLLPLKALVNDKFRQFTEIYSSLGIKTIEATGESDDISPLLKGQYDICLLTYEKLLAVILGNPHVLEQVGILVIDEVQMIADKFRGANLEFLLTLLRIRRSEGIEPQIIALSAVIGNTNGLEGWFDASKLRREERPVPLDEGIIFSNGDFRYLTSDTNEEKFKRQIITPIFTGKNSSQNIVIPLVRKIIQKGGQAIVFREKTGETWGCAKYLAEHINLPPATEALSKLPSGDPSSASNRLRQCLQGGTAFHNSHLDREERLVIEESFRSKELKVIAATTTLAMGVNTPASDVIVVGLDHPNGPYSISEYKNITGRAGRLGYWDRGTSYLIVKEMRNEHHYWNYYISGKPEDIYSQFFATNTDLRSLIIRVISLFQKNMPTGILVEDIIRFLEYSFGAFQYKKQYGSFFYDHNHLQYALNDLEDHKLVIRSDNNQIQLTKLGFLAGESIVSVVSIIRFIECLSRLHVHEISDLQLLAICQISEELDNVYMAINKKSIKEQSKWQKELRKQGLSSVLINLLTHNAEDQATVTTRMKKSIAMIAYISEMTLEDIEIFLTSHMRKEPIAGAIRQTAARTCDVLPTVAQIAEYLYPNHNIVDKVDLLLARLATGASSEMTYLTLYTGTKLTRGNYLALMKAGFTSFEKLEQADDIALLDCLGADNFKLTVIRDAIYNMQRENNDEEISLKPYKRTT